MLIFVVNTVIDNSFCEMYVSNHCTLLLSLGIYRQCGFILQPIDDSRACESDRIPGNHGIGRQFGHEQEEKRIIQMIISISVRSTSIELTAWCASEGLISWYIFRDPFWTRLESAPFRTSETEPKCMKDVPNAVTMQIRTDSCRFLLNLAYLCWRVRNQRLYGYSRS